MKLIYPLKFKFRNFVIKPKHNIIFDRTSYAQIGSSSGHIDFISDDKERYTGGGVIIRVLHEGFYIRDFKYAGRGTKDYKLVGVKK